MTLLILLISPQKVVYMDAPCTMLQSDIVKRAEMPEYCVTGGTGFIGAYLVKGLLDKGHRVRATVRNPDDVEKVGFLLKLNGAEKRLRLVKADLMVEGSFDEAVEGVDGVFHAASPVLVPYDENIKANLIDPCIEGTLNVLKSCSKAGSVKRVVLTSSCSAVRYREEQMGPLNETHWSDADYCKRHNLWYAYAKTIGEQEAWKFAKEKAIDLVVVNPSFVIGPLLAPKPTSTLLMVLAVIKGLRGEYPNTRVGFVDINDVVEGHVLGMEESKASGRLICSGEVAHWSDIIEMLRAKYPSYPYENKCGSQEGDSNPHSMDCGKILQLGHSGFTTIPEMFDECIKSFQDHGFL